MNVNIQELLEKLGLKEKLYPGKKVVNALQQPGENKSHAVVFDWHDSDNLRVDVRAGLSGKKLEPKDLAKYPISFQAETYLEIDTRDESDDGEDEQGKGKSGGSKGIKKKKDDRPSLSAFARVVEGKIPHAGEITKMVVMGKKIAEQAIGAVLETLVAQIQHAKVAPTELLAHAGKFVTKITPPEFMKPKEGEHYDATYKYDREKNEAMFGGMSLG